MIVEKILGNINDISSAGASPGNIDCVPIEWYEAHNKILHKHSRRGLEVGIRREDKIPLHDGDILWRDGNNFLIVEITECECLALTPGTMTEMAEACYAIGNRHAPLFLEDGELLTPYDEPLITVLSKLGFTSCKKTARLTRNIRGSANGHPHSH